MNFLAHWNYIIVIIMMMAGFYVVISSTNLIKKLIGLGTFQTAVFIFYISLGKVKGGTAPILLENLPPHQLSETVIYSNPLSHVLILTAIVVGVATLAVGLALAVRIYEAYGTLEEDAIHTIDAALDLEEDEADKRIMALWENKASN